MVTEDAHCLLNFPARKQQTIARPVTVQGVGYWLGNDVRVQFRPAPPNTGIVFVRYDLPGCPQIPATIDNWLPTPRRTTLCRNHVRVEMVEHLLAALAGLQIDNCEVWINGCEMPGLDGSCLPLVEALETAGVVEQPASKPRFVVQHLFRVEGENCWLEARPAHTGQTILTYHLDYGPNGPIGKQSKTIVLTASSFRHELAASRTFMLKEEAEWLRAQGFGRRTSCRDLLVFDQHGPIDNQLRFPDECVRHKLLDMVGDLALAGCQLIGHFVAYRSGHIMNGQLVHQLLQANSNCTSERRCA